MTDTSNRQGRQQLLAYQLNLRLKIEGYSTQGTKDRKSQARTAQAERTERRRMHEMRRRPSYVAGETSQPFEPDVRLIRAKDRPGAPRVDGPEHKPKPTYEQMRAQRDEYPDMPADVTSYKQRRREERRRAERLNKRAERDRRKK